MRRFAVPVAVGGGPAPRRGLWRWWRRRLNHELDDELDHYHDQHSDHGGRGRWVNGFCSAFKDWTSALKPIAQSLQSTPTKENLQSSVGDIKDANKTLADDLKGLGKPDVSGGGQAKDVVDKLADQIKSELDQIAGALDNLSTTSDLVGRRRRRPTPT